MFLFKGAVSTTVQLYPIKSGIRCEAQEVHIAGLQYKVVLIITNFKAGQQGLFQFRILSAEIYDSIWIFGRTPTGDEPVARSLPTQDSINTEKH
jgi:hypothetical protein